MTVLIEIENSLAIPVYFFSFSSSIVLSMKTFKHWRSEERRVGKSVDLGGRRIIKKNFFQAEDGIRDSYR